MSAPLPKVDEVWRTRSGRVRRVVSVDEDGYWVMYQRPPPAPIEAITVLGTQWQVWVERENAVRIQKAWRAE